MRNLENKIETPWYLKNLRIKNVKWPYGLYLEEVQGVDDECWYFCDWLESGWVTCSDGVPRYLSRWGLILNYIEGVGHIIAESEKFSCIFDVNENGKIENCYID